MRACNSAKLCAGDKARAVAAYEGKFIVRFGAKNSRFPQVSR